MTRLRYILVLLVLLLFSCREEKVPGTGLQPVEIDHIRWGSRIGPLEGVTISWRSKGKADRIQWGYSGKYEQGVYDAVSDSDYVGGLNKHEFTFARLQPSSTIFYRLFDSGISGWTGLKTFQTASDPAGNHFKFTAGGDSRSNLTGWHKVSENIEVCDFSLYLGDIVADGRLDFCWEDWYKYGEKFISSNLAFHIRGNHDLGIKYFNNLVNPGNRLYYSFGFGNSVFIALDYYDPDTWDEQSVFLEDVLKNNREKTWKFIFFHAPFFTSLRHVGEMDALRSSWWKHFDDYGVDLIFNAHEHSYLRTVPINLNISDTAGVKEYGSGPTQGRCQVIAAQYGAPPYGTHEGWFVAKTFSRLHYTRITVNGSELELKAIDVETGEVFDSLSLRK